MQVFWKSSQRDLGHRLPGCYKDCAPRAGPIRNRDRWADTKFETMKSIIILVLSCLSVLASEGDIRVFSVAHTNAPNNVYAKDEFTRDGQTNLVVILKVAPQGWARISASTMLDN